MSFMESLFFSLSIFFPLTDSDAQTPMRIAYYILCAHIFYDLDLFILFMYMFSLCRSFVISCVHYCTVCLFDGYRCIRHLLLLLHLLFLKSFTLSAYFSFSSSVLSAFWLCYECYFDGFRTFHCENSICKISHIFH